MHSLICSDIFLPIKGKTKDDLKCRQDLAEMGIRQQLHPVGQTQYAQMIGNLLHLMNFSRPDIAYAAGRLSRYIHNPNQDHWDALARLMRYLRGTMDYGIKYSGFPVILDESPVNGGLMTLLGVTGTP